MAQGECAGCILSQHILHTTQVILPAAYSGGGLLPSNGDHPEEYTAGEHDACGAQRCTQSLQHR